MIVKVPDENDDLPSPGAKLIIPVEPPFEAESDDNIPVKKLRKPTSLLRKTIIIGLSFFFSIMINLYNTHLFSKKRYNLGLPLFAASLYDCTQLVLASLILGTMEWRTGPGVLGSFQLLSRRQLFRFILPCGIAAGLNIALSNSSLQYISLSFYTMVKSCSPVFVLIFAFAFGLEKLTPALLGIMFLIGVGIILTVWDAFSFNLLGFVLVFGATIVSGLRWTLTQLIIESSTTEDIDEGNALAGSGPLRTMIILAPIIAVCQFTLSMIFEGPLTILTSSFFNGWRSSMVSFGICLFGGLQSFALVLLEYKVVQETSVLTFSIAGIIKEILIIILSVVVFGDKVKIVNIVGALISIVGIFLYNFYKTRKNLDISAEERKHRRAMQNMFMAVPTSEPTWMMDQLNQSTDSLNSTTYFWSFAPQPSPAGLQQPKPLHLENRRNSDTEPAKSSQNLHNIGGSLRSSRSSSPMRRLRSNSNQVIIELNRM